jgi:hypothetical protein
VTFRDLGLDRVEIGGGGVDRAGGKGAWHRRPTSSSSPFLKILGIGVSSWCEVRRMLHDRSAKDEFQDSRRFRRHAVSSDRAIRA